MHGQWRPIQSRTDGKAAVRNPQTGKAYWAGATLGFGATLYRNWDVIRPVGAGIAGGVAGFAAGGPAGAAQGADAGAESGRDALSLLALAAHAPADAPPDADEEANTTDLADAIRSAHDGAVPNGSARPPQARPRAPSETAHDDAGAEPAHKRAKVYEL